MSSQSSVTDIPGTGDSRQRAAQACSACRKQKKGCDKLYPTCSSCERLRRVCHYEIGSSSQAVPDGYEALAQRLTDLENEMVQHRAVLARVGLHSSFDTSSIKPFVNTAETVSTPPFPNAFFLDVEAFQRHKMTAPVPQMAVPDKILKAIGTGFEIRAIVGAHFFSVFTWIAIVSRTKMYEDIAVPPEALASDVALLVLSMKLLNDMLSGGLQEPRNNLYFITKEFFTSIESRGINSIRLLQAGVLIALYEMGHAIYPEAYLTIGRVGRIGQAIGLQDTAGIPQLALEPETWDAMEERRRVWWGLYILNRNMNIGNPTRSLALAEAARREYLPIDDKSWSEGSTTPSEPLFVSSAINVNAAPTTRLCQASHLLSLVLTHVNDRESDPNTRLEEAQQLSRALVSLSSFMLRDVAKDPTKVCVPKAICYSALITLYEHELKAGQSSFALPAEHELHTLAKDGMEALVPVISDYSIKMQTTLPFNTNQVSPLVINCLYRMASWLSRTTATHPRDDYALALTSIIQGLHKIDSRWKVAGAYLKILEEPISQSPMDEDSRTAQNSFAKSFTASLPSA